MNIKMKMKNGSDIYEVNAGTKKNRPWQYNKW